jgi:hypothetical protein
MRRWGPRAVVKIDSPPRLSRHTQAGAAQSRQQLAGIFWPDTTEAQARTHLRRELHNLRAALGEEPSLRIHQASVAWSDSPSCRGARRFMIC